MSAIHPLRALLSAALVAAAAMLGASCGGSFEAGSGAEGVHPGGACSQNGLKAKAADGCNTCTCESGTWSCTELACTVEDGGSQVPGPCTPGASRSAGDGCNTCQCTAGGTWACTRSACAACQDGDEIELDVPARGLTLRVDDTELAKRRAKWKPPGARYQRGWGALFSAHVLQADEGCDFDVLVRGASTPEPEIHRKV